MVSVAVVHKYCFPCAIIGSRKRTATQQPDDSDNEDEEPKKKKLAATKSPLKTKQNKAVSSGMFWSQV